MKTPHIFRKVIWFFAIILLTTNCTDDEKEYGVESVPDPKEIDGGYVSNPDNILSPYTVEQVNNELASLDQSGTAQVAVVILESIGEQVPKDFAVGLFNHWKIGIENIDNGLLILLVKDQRRVEFETGYGLEGDLPDITCFRIQQDHMVPYFKQDDYDNGILQGVYAIVNHLNKTSTESDIEQYNTSTLGYTEVTWQDNIYTVKKSNKVSFLEAWSIVRNTYYHGELPLIPDTTLATVTETSDGFIHTIQIPYEISLGNGIETFGNSIGSILVYSVIVIIAVFASFSKDRTKYIKKFNKKEKNHSVTLFSSKMYANNLLTLLFLLGIPIILIETYFILFQEIDVPLYVSVGACYLAWCVYVHLHYMVILPVKARIISTKDRHNKHEVLAEAYRNLKIFTFLFPFPFLLLFRSWHQVRMRQLRDTPYQCECGAQMTRLDEVADDQFLSPGDVKEEILNSVDYDVWICHVCNRQKVLHYENYRSSIIRCKSCSKKTVKMTEREVVVDSTTSTSGYGYLHYHCLHCDDRAKIRFTIPKKSDSSSSGSSGSSSSSSWGGGASGGGGAGSSW